MSEMATTESSRVNQHSAGVVAGMGEPEAGAPETGWPKTPQAAYAVQLTEEEWHEQTRLKMEYVTAITKDKKRAAEILPKIVWPAFILKVLKKDMGANYIRKEGYNTIDADLLYGPGWLDEEDGGPTCSFSEDYKPLGKYEFPLSWREPW